ncbi:thioredoxin domain-containing protein 6 [Boothiomyces sp. JEL0838]|nr:thioredoxin domain-containing protein 6 [Boothiomyces sp. JEL0838]
MSAHGKKVEVVLPSLVATDEEWTKVIAKGGLKTKWAGPCEAMNSILKRLKLEYAEELTIFQNDILVHIVYGANSPQIEKVFKEQLDLEKNGRPHKPVEGDIQIVAEDEPRPSQVQSERKSQYQHIPDPKPVSSSNEALASPSTPPNLPQTFALIKPDAMIPAIIEGILDEIRLKRFTIVKKKKVWMTPEIVEEFYKEHVNQPFFKSLVTYFTSGPCLAMVLAKENAVKEWRQLIGPANSKQAKEEAPRSLRAHFGTDNRINAVFGSDSQESANREIEIFFGRESKVIEMPIDENELSTKGSPGVQKTLCIIKPDAMNHREDIIERIICRGLLISKREEMHLNNQQVEDLYHHIKDTEAFPPVLEQMTKSSVLALVLKGDNAVNIWKELAGPEDPELAKQTLPLSIRAMFGQNAISNAVHVSESAERATQEIQIFFPYTLERGPSVVDARYGTATNPFPAGHHGSVEEIHARTERTVALIKPDAYGTGKKDAIIEKITAGGFKIVKGAEVQFSLAQAQEFYKEHQGKPFFDELVNWMSGTPIYAMVLEKEGAIDAWRELAGPTNSVKARDIAPQSIRALYGTDGSQNAVHGSDSPASAEREIKVVFGDEVSPFPEPLLGPESQVEAEEVPTRPSQTANRTSVVAAENVLNLILGNENKEGSKSNLLEKSASKAQLSKSKPVLASKTNVSNLEGARQSSKASISNLEAARQSSKVNLSRTGSASKPDLASSRPQSGMKRAVSSNMVRSRPTSAADLTKSKASLSSRTNLGSKSNLMKTAIPDVEPNIKEKPAEDIPEGDTVPAPAE